jgi:hypothetical protein
MKAVFATAQTQIDNLVQNGGTTYNIFNPGIKSGPDTDYMNTGTALAVPDASNHFGLGVLDTDPVGGNTIIVPNDYGISPMLNHKESQVSILARTVMALTAHPQIFLQGHS